MSVKIFMLQYWFLLFSISINLARALSLSNDCQVSPARNGLLFETRVEEGGDITHNCAKTLLLPRENTKLFEQL